jgi:addiction module RelE/StbE family toxin
MKLVVTASFKRAYKTLTRRNPKLKQTIANTLERLGNEPFDPTLRTHKLKGKLANSWACSLDYDRRIIFDIVLNPENQEREILLIDIGSHDEVY